MKVKTECSRCSKVHFINVSAIIEALLKTIESDSVYGGFLCRTCSRKLHEE
jgi:DNA-directed RNA polymerase subunit RPC12/RpoP